MPARETYLTNFLLVKLLRSPRLGFLEIDRARVSGQETQVLKQKDSNLRPMDYESTALTN